MFIVLKLQNSIAMEDSSLDEKKKKKPLRLHKFLPHISSNDGEVNLLLSCRKNLEYSTTLR